MNNKQRKSKSTSLTDAVHLFENACGVLDSPETRALLNGVAEDDAAALRGAILRSAAYLDDSVSNEYLGSLFDRTEDCPLNQMLTNIASAYGVAATVAGTTGTTGLNVPAAMSLASEGQPIAIARDCHVSIAGGLCLSGAVPIYLVPPFDQEAGVLLPPTPEEVATLLDANPDVRSIVVTMPTYHGLMGDVAGIVTECHRRKVVVMVDGAHGPHLHFLQEQGFPIAAEDAGADIVSQSTHKVLSALNQASLLHFNNEELIGRYEEFQSMGFQSTSFSYPILLSIEHAIEQMVNSGPRIWSEAAKRARRLRDGLSQIDGIRGLDESIVDGHRVLGLDPTRVTINVRDTGLTGYQIAEQLLERGLIVEMATPDVVLFLISPSTTNELVDDTIRDIREIVAGRVSGSASRRNRIEPFVPPALPSRVLTPRQAMSARRERVSVKEAVGRVIGETIGCFPPGQAIYVAGERITEEGVQYLRRAVDEGGHLKRTQNDHFQTIDVVIED